MGNTSNNAETTTHEKLMELLESFRSVMLITHSNNGEIAARPMTVVEVENGSIVWLPLSINSGTLDELTNGCEVYLTAQSSSVYVVATGVASLYRDSATIKKLWSEPLRVWFPDGPEDPELAFLRIEIVGGEYWDVSGLNKVRYAFNALKSYLSHERPEIEEPEMHGTAPRGSMPTSRPATYDEVVDRSVI